MKLRNSRFGKFYGCTRWPDCDGTHGAHPDGKPLGVPADKETREARIRAHAAFDKLWKTRRKPHKARGQAYRWLRGKLNLDRHECHIGGFDKAGCARVIEVCEELAAKYRENRADSPMQKAMGQAAAEDDTPRTQCPKCGAWLEDFDGFGVVAHKECGYCCHPSGQGDTCDVCGGDIEDTTHTWGKKRG